MVHYLVILLNLNQQSLLMEVLDFSLMTIYDTKWEMIWKCFWMGAQNLFLLRLALTKRKKIIVGLIYRHPRMPVNDFWDNLLIECLNKILAYYFFPNHEWLPSLNWSHFLTIPTNLWKWIVNFWHTFKQFPLNFLSWTFFMKCSLATQSSYLYGYRRICILYMFACIFLYVYIGMYYML